MRIKAFLHSISLLAIFMFTMSKLYGQVSGFVKDGETGEFLSFVQIQQINSKNGCFSGLDGSFSLPKLSKSGDSIRLSLLGYLPLVLFANEGTKLEVEMFPGGIALEDVVIHEGENPALRIMRNVVAQRGENDPQKFDAYSFDSYNKIKAMPVYNDGYPDSLRMKIPLFLSETVSHRDQYGFGKAHEEIKSAKLAGYPGEVLPFTASDLQDLSFYQNYIGVIGMQFLSPVSPNGLRQYEFELREVIPFGVDTIFQIHFKPKQANFDALEGTFRIHNDSWAISTAEAKLIFGGQSQLFIAGNIRQVYVQDYSGKWLPWQVFTQATTKTYTLSMPIAFDFTGFSEIRNQALNVDFEQNYHADKALVLAKDAAKTDSLLLANRSQPLDSLEKASYHLLDSLGEKFKLPLLLNQSYKLAENRLGIGPFDLMLDKIYTQNQVEGSRFGLGLMTNEKVTTRGNLRGEIGYGWRDKRFKYAGQINIFPLANPRLFLGARYSDNLVETGFRREGLNPNALLFEDQYAESGIRNWYLKRMEYIQSREAWIGGEPVQNVALKAGWRLEKTVPAYENYFADSNRFAFSEAVFQLRWAPGTRYAWKNGRRIPLANNSPITSLRYTKGFADAFGDFDYQSLQMAVYVPFQVFNGGQAAFSLFAGGNDRSLPRTRMHVYRGAYSRKNPTSLMTAFNTMRYDEFAADVYAEAFLSFSPKFKWLRLGKKIRPKIKLSGAAAWGYLYPESYALHGPVDPRTPSKIFLEPSITVTHILPIPEKDNLAMTFLRGFGFTMSYRTGYYTFSNWKRNFIARLTFSL